MTADGDAFIRRLTLFVRTLRSAGLKLGPGDTVAALDVARRLGIADRDDLRRGLAAVLVRGPGELPLFREAFRLFFEQYRDLSSLASAPHQRGNSRSQDAEAGRSRLAEALAAEALGRELRGRAGMGDRDRSGTASVIEVVRRKDFEQMSRAEAEMARTLLRRAALPLAPMMTRRSAVHPRGRRPDLRATLRRSLREGGEPVELVGRRRRRRPPPLVLLCDISGSMSVYTRMFLHFAHALTGGRDRVHTFLFGTRLSAVTRRLRDRDPDRAVSLIAREIDDWDGGTRIGAALNDFNRDWGRRVLGQGAVVLLLTDGLEREADDRLVAGMERLASSSRRLIWLNPLLRFDSFEPRARGIRLMLPYTDDFVPVHNVASLEELAARLATSLRDGRKAA